jgi:hypothetical protein
MTARAALAPAAGRRTPRSHDDGGGAVAARPRRPLALGGRSFWLKHLHRWHWISAAACLVGMLLFAATGITLNHAA